MRLRPVALLGVCLFLFIWGGVGAPVGGSGLPTGPRGVEERGVTVIPRESSHRVDVEVDGRPFTSYMWPDQVRKPILFPLRSADGQVVTRGFPLEPHDGERTDHPHQVGLWFNYGNVNGFDFWNNSPAVKSSPEHRYGSIIQKQIVAASSGLDKGELRVKMQWVTDQGKPLLDEETLFVFRKGPGLRIVDRITKLTAIDQDLSFHDDKEGMVGMRVARSLEMPSTEDQVFVDSSGKRTSVAKSGGADVSGSYESSEGLKDDAVWGTRARWVMLKGRVDGKPVTIAMFDHPGNPGFPAFWHARGYGLFGANPLGQKIFTNGKTALEFGIKRGESAWFRYRVAIVTGVASAQQAQALYHDFSETE